MIVAGHASVQGALGIREANKTVSTHYIDFVILTLLLQLGSFGLEPVFSDFELRISEVSGVSRSQSCR